MNDSKQIKDEFMENPEGPATSSIISAKINDFGSDSSRDTKNNADFQSAHYSKNIRGMRRESLSKNRNESDNNNKNNRAFIIYPWGKVYNTWNVFVLCCAVFTVFYETYQVAFGRAGFASYNKSSYIIDYGLTFINFLDIVKNLQTAFYDENDNIVEDKGMIIKNYSKKMLWIDLLGVIPFYEISLAISGELGNDNHTTQILAILRLFRLFRLHKLSEPLHFMQNTTSISLLTLTLIRNFSVTLIWAHVAACIFYFISRQYSFNDKTWIGDDVNDLTEIERYMTTFYWSIVTFTTVGYGDFSPVNVTEQIWVVIYMLINIVLQSWIIGSITLVMGKSDKKTGDYRNAMETLAEFSRIHSFPKNLQRQLQTQLKLGFYNQEVADEKILQHFPTSVRRQLLRKLYFPLINRTELMNGVRQQFVDEFLATCVVELHAPGEDILVKNSISSYLYLLVEGTVIFMMGKSSTDDVRRKNSGFLNHFGFFTESPELESVKSETICRSLSISRSAYKLIAQDHPGSAGRILKNLLRLSAEDIFDVELPQSLPRISVGSDFYHDDDSNTPREGKKVDFDSSKVAKKNLARAKLQDLVRMHISKQNDDHTTRFLYAASRGDTSTMTLMIEQGFDPNSADYDSRTALMVASMKGNSQVVDMLLECGVDVNIRDMHGSTALYEAARNGNEEIMHTLLEKGAELCLKEITAASILCQAIFEGDVILLTNLLKARIDVNAADYDKRAAVHIAAAEGNVAALKVLVEFHADLKAKDRWGKNAFDEAKSSNAILVQQFLSSLRT